ncbi:aminotransferase class V-fold PLP-dependent enzyme [Hyphobacterium sp.]|uniref:aminotransferase class V-fold PLP-dependent enzyme n=1 Tax=Hyphobacterium sp. TaxID=2004662 RepID=UPI003BAB7DCA
MITSEIRPLFDLPRDLAYLNCAYMGPMPKHAALEGQNAYDLRQRPWELNIQENFFDLPEALRGEAAKPFRTEAKNIALIPAASYGLAVAARNLPLAAGQEILVLDAQFPSNVYVWRDKAAASNAVVKTVRRSANESWTEAVLGALSAQSGIVAIPQVHWADGGTVDLKAVREAADEHGARLVLDITQSLGALPFPMAEVRPDYAVAAGYKWLLGPYTLGYLYVAPEHQGGQPLEAGWIVREGAEDLTRLADYADHYKEGARRFDMGERSAFQLVRPALTSLRWLNGLGDDLLAGLSARTHAIEEAVRSLGARCDTPDRAPHYLCLALPDDAPADLAGRLAARGVSVSQRGDRLRVTPHLYNDQADIDRFADALRAELA